MDLPLLSYNYQSCMFVDFLIEYISPFIVFNPIECKKLLLFEDVFQSFLNMCLYDVLLFNSH